jgi:hypothetical protein
MEQGVIAVAGPARSTAAQKLGAGEFPGEFEPKYLQTRASSPVSKPLRVVRPVEGSNPSPSAQASGDVVFHAQSCRAPSSEREMRDFGILAKYGAASVAHGEA